MPVNFTLFATRFDTIREKEDNCYQSFQDDILRLKSEQTKLQIEIQQSSKKIQDLIHTIQQPHIISQIQQIQAEYQSLIKQQQALDSLSANHPMNNYSANQSLLNMQLIMKSQAILAIHHHKQSITDTRNQLARNKNKLTTEIEPKIHERTREYETETLEFSKQKKILTTELHQYQLGEGIDLLTDQAEPLLYCELPYS